MKDRGNGFVKDESLESIYIEEPIYDTDDDPSEHPTPDSVMKYDGGDKGL